MNWLYQRALRLQVGRDIGELYLVECALAAAMVTIAAVACMPSLSTKVGDVVTRIDVLLHANIP